MADLVLYDTKGADLYPTQEAYELFTADKARSYGFIVRKNTTNLKTELFLFSHHYTDRSFVFETNTFNQPKVSLTSGGYFDYTRIDGTIARTQISPQTFNNASDFTPIYGEYSLSQEEHETESPSFEKEAKKMPIVSMGTTLRKGDAAIANLTSIDGVGVSSDTIETTNLSNESGYRTFVTSLKDAGEVSLSGHFDFDSHNVLLQDFEDGNEDTYTIEFPDRGTATGTQWTFTAVVTAFSTSVELEDLIGFEATLKVSGRPTLMGPA